MKSIRLTLPFMLCFLAASHAMEIPLDGRAQSTENGAAAAENFAYIDIERIFAEHPMTARFKEEFQHELDKRKTELQIMENEIAAQQRIVVSTGTEITKTRIQIELLKNMSLPAPAVTASTDTATSTLQPSSAPAVQNIVTPSTTPAQIPADIAALENELREKEAGLETIKQGITKKQEAVAQKIKQNKEELLSIEEKQTQKVLSDIYHLLDIIAKEERLSIIIDKNNVLYGQAGQDITEKVSERLQGR